MTDTGIWTEDEYEKMREFQADLTPIDIVMQGLSWLKIRFNIETEAPIKILDPCAGYGVFGECFRKQWPNSTIFAIEPRTEAEEHLKKTYDDYMIDYVENSFEKLKEWGPFDLISTNPAFKLIAPKNKTALPVLLKDFLKPSGFISFLGQDDVGQRSVAGTKLFSFYPPIRQGRICGPIGFRGPGIAQDARDYSWWVWSCNTKILPASLDSTIDDIPTWNTDNLPMLSAESRKWKIIPGTEYIHGYKSNFISF